MASEDITILSHDDLSMFERFQPIVDELGPSQANRMSSQPIDQLSRVDPLVRYTKARQALKAAGFSGEAVGIRQVATPSRFNIY